MLCSASDADEVSQKKQVLLFSAGGEPLFWIHFLGVSSRLPRSMEDILFSAHTSFVALNLEWICAIWPCALL